MKQSGQIAGEYTCETPEVTLDLGKKVGAVLNGGEVILLEGTLGAGKTLLTKGIVESLGYDSDEVTSPSFTLVNFYRSDKFEIYHVDLWRIEEEGDIFLGVGLDEILENEKAVVIIEWAERLDDFRFDRPVFQVRIEGDGEEPRKISIKERRPAISQVS